MYQVLNTNGFINKNNNQYRINRMFDTTEANNKNYSNNPNKNNEIKPCKNIEKKSFSSILEEAMINYK